MKDITFLGWQDDEKKKSARQKLDEGLAAFASKYGRPADICLMSVADAIAIGPEPDGLHIEGRTYIAKNVMYLGEVPR